VWLNGCIRKNVGRVCAFQDTFTHPSLDPDDVNWGDGWALTYLPFDSLWNLKSRGQPKICLRSVMWEMSYVKRQFISSTMKNIFWRQWWLIKKLCAWTFFLSKKGTFLHVQHENFGVWCNSLHTIRLDKYVISSKFYFDC